METERYISRMHLGNSYQDFDKFTYAELGAFVNSSFFQVIQEAENQEDRNRGFKLKEPG